MSVFEHEWEGDIQALADLLEADSPRVRGRAVFALGKVDGEE